MVDIVLVEPEIPNNTGAIARTCACTGDISVYENIDEYFAKNGDENLWLLTTKASVSYVDADLSTPNVTLMFGKETKGLPEWLRERYADHCLRIPMRAEARSLNLYNTAAILCYEALRQQIMLGQIDLNV